MPPTTVTPASEPAEFELEIGGSASAGYDDSQPYQPRTRKPRTPKAVVPSKDKLEGLLAMANFATVNVANLQPPYPLTPQEVSQLADALHTLLKEYPSVASYIVVGNKLTAWAGLGMVLYGIAAPRIIHANAIRATAVAGRARPTVRNDGLRQNGTSRIVPVPPTVGSSDRSETGTEMASVSSHNGYPPSVIVPGEIDPKSLHLPPE